MASPTLAYLSAGPRVSTRSQASGGPRAHVLGTIQGFRSNGWNVNPYIVGDRMPASWSSQESENSINRGVLRPLLADAVRLGLGLWNSRQAWKEIGPVATLAYERNAAMQTLGSRFQRHGIPWILETNAPLFYEAKTERKTMMLSGYARRIELRAYRQCDVLVCVSKGLRDLIVNEAGIPLDKTIVLHNGVDTVVFDPYRYTPIRLFDGFTIGFVGKLFGWQGLDLLLKAIAELRDEGTEVNLVVVGDGVARPRLEAMAGQLNLTENVVFTGQKLHEEVPSYIAGFDIGYSGQVQLPIGVMYRSPLKIYEYMAMAKPVIASAFEDAQEVIKDQRYGYLFEPGSKESLKRAINAAYQQREQLQGKGAASRRSVVEHHSWRLRVEYLVEKVNEILHKRGHTGATAGGQIS